MSELSLKAQELEQDKAQRLLSNEEEPYSFDRNINPDKVRSTIDPNNTLPSIKLREQPGIQATGSLVPRTRDILYEGKAIGVVTVISNNNEKVSYINQITIDEKYRGRGIGLSTYVQIIQDVLSEGFTFRTHDWSQSEASRKIWDVFVDAGLAQVKEKFVKDTDGKFHGVLEISPEER